MKRKYLRKLGLLFAVIMLIVTALGCGSQSSDNSSVTEEPQQEETQDTQETREVSETQQESSGKMQTSAETGNLLESNELKPYKIALVIANVTSLIHREVVDYVKYLSDQFGCEVQVYDCKDNLDEIINNSEAAINWGADAILTHVNTATQYRLVKMCSDAEVYVGGFLGYIDDEEVEKAVEMNPYWLGCTYEDEYSAGVKMAESLIALGAKKMAVCSIPIGLSTANDRRWDGIMDTLDNHPEVELVTTARSIDFTPMIQTAVAMGDQIDSLIMTGGGLDFGGQVIINAGRAGELLFASVDIGDNTRECLEKDVIQCLLGGHYPGAGFTFVLAYNALMGTPLRNDDGSAPMVISYYTDIDSMATYENYLKYCSNGEYAFYGYEMAELIQAWNPEADLQKFNDVMASYNLADVMKRHTDVK